MARLRLILEQRFADADGRLAGAEYHTADVEVPDGLSGFQVTGGEWLKGPEQEPRELGMQIRENWVPEPRTDADLARGR